MPGGGVSARVRDFRHPEGERPWGLLGDRTLRKQGWGHVQEQQTFKELVAWAGSCHGSDGEDTAGWARLGTHRVPVR